ncbi:DUF6086 family protein [Amycolatopsis solani]|uniref:DUF6086 family protein n=1 Tax=Amycolatopsis solani TaxID=3028615 RepID=UPI0025B1BE24|nr:DUF6086 family protein [Amycolatopsis sp. MEP2-6]
MSYVFDVDGEVVWSPALRIGKLFVSTAETLAGNAGVGLADAGLTMMASDYYYVNPAALAAFVRSSLAGSMVVNPVYAELSRGFLVVSLVVLDRCGVDMTPEQAAHGELFEARDALASSM